MAAIKIVQSSALAANARSLWLGCRSAQWEWRACCRTRGPARCIPSGINLHAIFGALLWLLVVAQIRPRQPRGSASRRRSVHELCRRLSRQVYLLLYLLFGVSQIVRIARAAFGTAATSARRTRAILPPPENLRDYLAYGVFALLTLHALAAAQCHALKRAIAAT